jgi:hypothetical protein
VGEEVFTIVLDTKPVPGDVARPQKGTAGLAKPRLFVRAAPHMPTADQLAFTDFPGSAQTNATLSVRVNAARQGAGIWYVGVYNAAPDTVTMDFSLSVVASGKKDRISSTCHTWTSQTCEDDPVFQCDAGGVISEIEHFDLWYNQSNPVLQNIMVPASCSDSELDERKYQFCHERFCPQSQSCIGKQSCTISTCSAPPYFIDLCYSQRSGPCGVKMRFKCRYNAEDDPCAAGRDPCSEYGICQSQNGLAICECSAGWTGADCKTPPPFQARLASPEAEYISAVEAWPENSGSVPANTTTATPSTMPTTTTTATPNTTTTMPVDAVSAGWEQHPAQALMLVLIVASLV